MRRVTLHGLDEVGNEIGAALQLHVDARPRLFLHLPRLDQTVIDEDDIKRDCRDDCQRDEHELRFPASLRAR
ncbi:hypothetical protein D3C78_1543450 [compost metagenome]